MGNLPNPETLFSDPLLRHIELPIRAAYYPAGFRLELRTNSRDVAAAAEESWAHCVPVFDRPPLQMRVIVRPDGDLAPAPSYRSQEHLYAVVSDADNFAVADLHALLGSICVSARTAADHAWFRWFFLEAVAYTLLTQSYLVPAHAACVARGGAGLLLCGPSGAGKSTLSFACARAGWTFIADDCAWLLPDVEDRIAVGMPRQVRLRPDAPRWFPELAGREERARPNGKLTLEFLLSEFPQIRTASRCTVRQLVVLNRRRGPARLEVLPRGEAADSLLHDAPSYSDEVNRLRLRTFERLHALPSYRLHYDALEDAIRLLSELQD